MTKKFRAKKEYRMTVNELIEILSKYSPILWVRFHTSNRHNLHLLSDYINNDKKPKYLEIDIGDSDE